MANLDFIGFINANIGLTNAKKLALLNDFCEQNNYQTMIVDPDGNSIPNPQTKQEFANEKLNNFLRESVNQIRKKRSQDAATYETLTY
jgi:hypothetical protein